MKESKRSKKIRGFMKRVFPYLVLFAVILTIMITGSRDEQRANISSTLLNVINDNNFAVTTDQLSESFIVAETASIFNLPTANSIGENFVSIALRYETIGGAQDTDIIEKPVIIDTSSLARGIITYTVQPGDTLASIATRFNLTATQIRWSNNMRNEVISEGQTLFLPSVSGILYTVRADDTLESIAERYQSNASQIRTLNDLEITGLVAGQTIILPGGILPETERPEYVRPSPRPPVSSAVLTDSGVRHDMRELYSSSYWRSIVNSARGDGNPSAAGQCTWFSWWWRANYGVPLPSGVIGNARDWVSRLRGSYVINHYPSYGAVVQTRTSGWGHVGIVTGVVEGEYIIIQEMNYLGPFRVNEARVYWADATNWLYIHGRL